MQKPDVVNFSNNSALAELNKLVAEKRLRDGPNKNGMVSGLNDRTAKVPQINPEPQKIAGEENLSPDQARAIRLICSGKNIFLTGPAGTGKSYTIHKITEIYTAKGLKVALTSTSGNSAMQIGGKTIHSWSGIHLCKTKESAIQNVLKYKKPQFNINTTDLLILDEVSMMSADILDVLDYVCRIVRNRNAPFGGIQVLLCGDFYQLAPVKASRYAFESDNWDHYINEMVELSQVFRQEDKKFVSVLNKIRRGDVDDEVVEIFEPCIGREYTGIVKPTELYPVNEWVDAKNEEELFLLQTDSNPIQSFEASDDVPKNPKSRYVPPQKVKDEALAKLEKECRAPKELLLCIGAQVMLLKNLNVEAGLANGSRGVILGYDGQGWPIVEFVNGHQCSIGPEKWRVRYSKDVVAERIQFPLKLAWAMSIHKSQGISVDLACVELGDRIFGDGMIYVALSRCRSLEGLQIKSINWDLVQVSKRVKKFYEKYGSKL